MTLMWLKLGCAAQQVVVSESFPTQCYSLTCNCHRKHPATGRGRHSAREIHFYDALGVFDDKRDKQQLNHKNKDM